MSGNLVLPDRHIASPAPSLNIQIDAATVVQMLFAEFKKVVLDYEKRIAELEARLAKQ